MVWVNAKAYFIGKNYLYQKIRRLQISLFSIFKSGVLAGFTNPKTAVLYGKTIYTKKIYGFL